MAAKKNQNARAYRRKVICLPVVHYFGEQNLKFGVIVCPKNITL
jgi:hypothetical protein